MNFEPVLNTQRLTLSAIAMTDIEDVLLTMNNENTATTISFMTWPMTKAQAEDWCRKSEEGFKNKTDLHYIARDTQGNAPVGCIGLHHVGEDGRAAAEVGYWLYPSCEGKGYASEMLKAVLDLGFDRLALESVWATAIPSNTKSHRVLDKQGFRMVDKITKQVAAQGKVAERNVYELKKADYVAGN